MKLTVLGAGAWGSALAMHLAIKYPVTLWARNNGHISGMAKARSNPLYLGDFKFPDQLVLESNLDQGAASHHDRRWGLDRRIWRGAAQRGPNIRSAKVTHPRHPGSRR